MRAQRFDALLLMTMVLPFTLKRLAPLAMLTMTEPYKALGLFGAATWWQIALKEPEERNKKLKIAG